MDEKRKKLLGGVGGTVVFVGLGLLLSPGLAKLEPDARAKSAPIVSSLDEPAVSPGSTRAMPTRDVEPSLAASHADEGSFDCMIGPNDVIEIGSPVTGVIDEIIVERSDTVEEDQVLVRLEADVEAAAVKVARARALREVDVEASRASFLLDQQRRERAMKLFDNKAISLDQRQEVEAEAALSFLEIKRAKEDRRLASLQLEQATATLERRIIKSPVKGIVVERLMAPGEVVDEDPMLRIAQVDPLRVETLLPSSSFGQVKAGDQAWIVPEAPHDEPRTAVVSIVDRIIDGASGTFGVQLRLANPDHELPAGLRCTVRFGDQP